MATPRGRVLGLGLALLLALALGPVGAEEQVLLEDSFSGKEIGSRPGPWVYFSDDGNEITVAATPHPGGAIGDRCLKITRRGGTVWKPMVSGWGAGVPDSPLRLDFDWYLPALSGSAEAVLSVTLRGDGNINIVSVGLGGTGGVSISQDGDGAVPLGFPVRAGEWGHLTIVADPVSRKAEGAFDIAITQGPERADYPNVPFRPDHKGAYPDALWYSPTLHVGGGSPEHPAEAYVTNVKLTTTEPRAYR